MIDRGVFQLAREAEEELRSIGLASVADGFVEARSTSVVTEAVMLLRYWARVALSESMQLNPRLRAELTSLVERLPP